jgi:hypothetical protein
MMPSVSTVSWIDAVGIPRDLEISEMRLPQMSSRSFWTCSRFSGLMSVLVNGSTNDLNLPTRVTCTPMPYFWRAPAKNMGWLARPGMMMSP